MHREGYYNFDATALSLSLLGFVSFYSMRCTEYQQVKAFQRLQCPAVLSEVTNLFAAHIAPRYMLLCNTNYIDACVCVNIYN